MMTGKLSLTLGSVALVLAVTLSSVSADVMQYNGMGLYDSVKVYAPRTNVDKHRVLAGQMRVRYQDEDYLGYCVDINGRVGTTEVQERSWQTLRNGEQVAYLFETYADEVSTGKQAAALQVAIWEVLYEDSSRFDIERGSFHVRDHGVERLAKTMLDSLPGSYEPTMALAVLDSDGKQDILIGGGNSVPEPGVLALFGLVGMRVLSRRRRRKLSA